MKARFAGVKVINLDLGIWGLGNNGEGRKKGKEHREVESRVYAEEQDDGLCDQHAQRPKNGDHDDEVDLGHARGKRIGWT